MEEIMETKRFTSDQRNIIMLCMIAYSTLYFMRLNISLALEDMGADLALNTAQLGVITSAFFWTYAFGQLINGILGDHLPVRFMVFTGLFVTGILNTVISFAENYVLVLICWGVSGLFQSMLWSPIVKCVAKHFKGDQKVIASFALSISQVLGYMIAWAGSYGINQLLGWRNVFRIPGLLGIGFAIVWLVFFRYNSLGEKQRRTKGTSLLRNPVLLGFLGVIALYSIVFGLIKSSIDTWLPTMFSDVGNLPSNTLVITFIIVPIINFLGVLLSRKMVAKVKGDIYKTLLALWGGSVVVSLISVFMFHFHPVAVVISVMILFGFINGITPLFTSFIPLEFVKWDCVSTVTGFIDFAIYIGAAITGIVSGVILGDTYRWSALSIYWFLLLVFGMALAVAVYFWHRKLRKVIGREESSWD